ncbi:MAG TPA: 4-hydroxy-tetrahydrodipicolinate synthase [Acidimicrobiales bacterium]
MARWGRVATAMITPFDEEGRVDIDGAVRLARWLAEHGNEGLVVTGTTGEAPVLTDDEKVELWRAVAEAVTIPVVAGSGTYDTRHSVDLTKKAEAAGAAGILAVTPYYNRPSQAGLAAHFRAIAEATSLPVMLYDIPFRTGRKIAHDTLVALARDVDNIVAVKDAAANPGETGRLIAAAPRTFEVYSGDDAMTLPLLAVGAVGVVGVATHWAGEQMLEMVVSFEKGDLARAREINESLVPSFEFETGDDNPNPVPTKAMLRMLGLPAGTCRLPHVETDGDALRTAAKAIAETLGVAVA